MVPAVAGIPVGRLLDRHPAAGDDRIGRLARTSAQGVGGKVPGVFVAELAVDHHPSGVYLNLAAAWAWVGPPDPERLRRFVTAMVDLDGRDEELHPARWLRLGRPGPVTLRRSTCHWRGVPWHECDWWNLLPACPYTGWAINVQVRAHRPDSGGQGP